MTTGRINQVAIVVLPPTDNPSLFGTSEDTRMKRTTVDKRVHISINVVIFIVEHQMTLKAHAVCMLYKRQICAPNKNNSFLQEGFTITAPPPQFNKYNHR